MLQPTVFDAAENNDVEKHGEIGQKIFKTGKNRHRHGRFHYSINDKLIPADDDDKT
jgi:hypothetical protein